MAMILRQIDLEFQFYCTSVDFTPNKTNVNMHFIYFRSAQLIFRRVLGMTFAAELG